LFHESNLLKCQFLIKRKKIYTNFEFILRPSWSFSGDFSSSFDSTSYFSWLLFVVDFFQKHAQDNTYLTYCQYLHLSTKYLSYKITQHGYTVTEKTYNISTKTAAKYPNAEIGINLLNPVAINETQVVKDVVSIALEVLRHV